MKCVCLFLTRTGFLSSPLSIFSFFIQIFARQKNFPLRILSFLWSKHQGKIRTITHSPQHWLSTYYKNYSFPNQFVCLFKVTGSSVIIAKLSLGYLICIYRWIDIKKGEGQVQRTCTIFMWSHVPIFPENFIFPLTFLELGYFSDFLNSCNSFYHIQSKDTGYIWRITAPKYI